MIPGSLNNVAAVAAGGYHSLALKADGTVAAWGAGTTNSGSSPHYGQAIVPAGLSNVVATAAGAYHSLALKAEGTVVAWGAGATDTGSSPEYGQAMVPGDLSNVVMIAAGGYHSMSLQSDGTVLAWGDNTYGQTNVPAGLTNVAGIAAGRYFSLALKIDGTAVAWGDNSYSQTDTPNSVANVAGIADGGFHTLALENDGRPHITVQPFSQTVSTGATVRLSAMAVGLQPLSFQWQHYGTDIPGATNASLNLVDVQAASVGIYAVVVSNTAGVVISANAMLSIAGQPNPPHIDSLARLPDGTFRLQISSGPGTFAIEVAPDVYGWTQLSTYATSNAVFQYTDPDTNQASRFYRIRVLP